MKRAPFFVGFIFIVVLLFLSCKRELSCEGCNQNKPPMAVADPDTVIALLTDSVLLDGSTSRDPDGRIINYPWTKISGPESFAAASAATAKRTVKNIVGIQ
jgi:hypothetical protein